MAYVCRLCGMWADDVHFCPAKKGIDTGQIHRAPLLREIERLKTQLAERDATIVELRAHIKKMEEHDDAFLAAVMEYVPESEWSRLAAASRRALKSSAAEGDDG